MPRIAFADVAGASLASVDVVLNRYLPGGKRQGREYVARNPLRNDARPGSFSLNVDSGQWADFATGDAGGDMVSLVAYLSGSSQGEAADELAEFLGIGSIATTASRKSNGRVVSGSQMPADCAIVMPIPDDAPAAPDALGKLGNYAARWEYRDASGGLLLYVCRWNTVDGKYIRPLTLWRESGRQVWRWKACPTPRPLYGLHRLAARPDAPVLICEGEKSADAAGRILPGLVAVASLNGAQAPDKSEWTPLRGRRAVVWPDADEAGAKYAGRVASLARAAGVAFVGVLDLAHVRQDRTALAAGYDAADFEIEGRNVESLSASLTAALLNADVPAVPDVQPMSGEEIPGTSRAPADVPDVPQDGALSVPADARPCFKVFDEATPIRECGERKLRAGVWYFGIKEGRGEQPSTLTQQWVCTPLHIEAVTYDGQENNFGRLLRFRNTVNHWRQWPAPMEMLRGSGEELRGELLAMGVQIDPNSHRLLGNYIQALTPKRRMHCTLQVGWCGNCYALPDTVIGHTADAVIYQSGTRGEDEFTRGGTLEGWRKDIAAHAVGNPLLTLALSASFAGPMLAKCNAESGGLHLVGDSSTGKTTAVEAACATWGGPNYRRSWRATANGMEGAAALFNDGLLALDEISECDPREVGAIVYALGNGRGKQRANRSGAARGVTRWRCMVLSSGERTIATTMMDGGQRAKAGQSVRMLDVPAARRFGAWDDLRGFPDGPAMSDALKRAAVTHYGHAGRAFLERLTRDARDFCEPLERIKALPEFSPANAEGQDRRAAARFALIALAGEIATEYGITEWPEGAAVDAAATAFTSWRSLRGKGNDERRQILDRVASFIERNGDSRFSDADNNPDLPVRERAGWFRSGQDGRVYLFNADGLHEALKGFDFKRALDVLQQACALPAPTVNGERSKPLHIGARKLRLYPVIAAHLDASHER